MNGNAGQLAGVVLALLLLWVGVYWWWPTQPPVTVDDSLIAPVGAVDGAAMGGSGTLTAPLPAGDSQSPLVSTQPENPKVAVIPPSFIEHTVQSGDTFEAISLKYFGTKKHARAIIKSNPLLDPTKLKPGRIVKVPRDPANIQGLPVKPDGSSEPKPIDPNDSPERTHVVVSGDSLSSISDMYYGTPKHADLIYEANRGTMPNRNALKIGQSLVIPPLPPAKPPQ